ncbi:hypothetical protein P9314_12035 [Paenibacillus validus]|uniref:Uncharacterized protein n=1 Tax=Paenibacillus validus TaxID=44253 RepID=A0A7X2ZB43_9BACL|nr:MULTISPECIES: hypothetical protein [Paenibacillus]MED4601432.1 hypothetical protein [Paenibacillus validus]MED4607775.1 hypothetical protein [Paenibacillus validus]MUG71698.1 hypothetical protein [Paenibacillus validus]
MSRKHDKLASRRYEDLFLLFSKRVERVLAIVLIVLLSATICAQAILQIPYFRHLLVKVERLEGNPYVSSRTK